MAKFAVILPAAGRSSRFKDEYYKALENGKFMVPLDVGKMQRDLLAGIRFYDGKTGTWKNGWARSH